MSKTKDKKRQDLSIHRQENQEKFDKNLCEFFR